MLQFADILDKVSDAGHRADLTERLELVGHKIKFMDTVPVALLDASGNLNYFLNYYLKLAGGYLVERVENAVYVIYYEEDKDLNKLLQEVPARLSPEWEAYKNHRINLVSAPAYLLSEAEQAVLLVEDLAEMIHPGAFIFGQEGGKWIRFGS